MKPSERKDKSDRAALSRTIPVLDGIFGSKMVVEATSEGIELDGYATIDWEWIDSARREVRRCLRERALE